MDNDKTTGDNNTNTEPKEPQEPRDGGQTGNTGGQTGGDTSGDTGGRSYSQAELDGILKRKLADYAKDEAEKRKRADMDEVERLKAEKADVEAKAADTLRAANGRLLKTEAAAWLADAGVKPERREYALRLIDTSGIEVQQDGSHGAQLKAAVDKLIKDFPEFRGASVPAAGQSFGGGNGTPDPAKMSVQEYFEQRKKGFK